MVGKVFTQVFILQGPILALVYPWYTNNEHNDKLIYIYKNISYFIDTLYISVVLKERTQKCLPTNKTIHILLHVQYVKGAPK